MSFALVEVDRVGRGGQELLSKSSKEDRAPFSASASGKLGARITPLRRYRSPPSLFDFSRKMKEVAKKTKKKCDIPPEWAESVPGNLRTRRGAGVVGI